MVEEIEKFGAELESEALRNGKFARDREVGFDEARPLQDVAANVAVGARERLDECVGIEVLRWAALDDLACEIRIDGWTNGIARVAVVGRIVGKLRREGQAGLNGLDAAELPVAEEARQPQICAIRIGMRER